MNHVNAEASLPRSSLFSLALCASMCGTMMFPRGDAESNGAQLAALLAAFALLLIPVLSADRRSVCSAGNESAVFRILALPVSLGFIVRAAYVLSLHLDMVELYLLRKTPAAEIAAALLLTAWFIARRGLARLARTATLLLMLIAVPIAVLYFCGLYRSDAGEIISLAQPDMRSIPALLPSSVMCLSGFECCVFIRHGGKDAKRGAVTGAYLTAAAMAALSYIMCAGVLTVPGAEHMHFPLIETARVINIGGVILTERFDLLLVVIRIALLTMQLSVYAHCACAGASACSGGRIRTEKLLPWVLLVCGVLALLVRRGGSSEMMRRVSVWAFLLTLAVSAVGRRTRDINDCQTT